MKNYVDPSAGRRRFLRQAGHISALAGSPFAFNLLASGSAAAQSSGDHKALVCIFLAGGNDQSNTLLPAYSTLANSQHAAYRLGRGGLALASQQMQAILPLDYTGYPLALHSALSPLASLFASQRVAVLANVGPLAVPLSKADFYNGAAVPSQLFSHSDQQGAWQTGVPDSRVATGWMGRIGDLTHSVYNPNSGVSMCISVGGNTVMLAGNQVLQYQVTPVGPVPVSGLNPDSLYGYASGGEALRTLLTGARSHMLETELVTITKRAIETERLVSDAISTVNLTTPFPSTVLASQLRMAARLIGAHQRLGQRRQVFFVQAGDSYDFHQNLLADQSILLARVSEAMAAFHAATVELGMSSQVTSFTASDFGRTLQGNTNSGSDHGWGGHHFIMGGAVRGGRVYGQMPNLITADRDAGQGRLIPTTSVDELASTLALWFGVPDSQLSTVVPNIDRFAHRNLGFML